MRRSKALKRNEIFNSFSELNKIIFLSAGNSSMKRVSLHHCNLLPSLSIKLKFFLLNACYSIAN